MPYRPIGKPAPGVRRRLGEAKQVFQKLKRDRRHASLSAGKKLRVYKTCVVSKLLYNLSALWLTDSQMKPTAFLSYSHIKHPTSWGPGSQEENAPVTKTSGQCKMILCQVMKIRLYQLKLPGQILRRPIRHPFPDCINRFLELEKSWEGHSDLGTDVVNGPSMCSPLQWPFL